jgi:diadenosine tetraphosphatase ApaH/serine/threonine PP2A family protein phosphatase
MNRDKLLRFYLIKVIKAYGFYDECMRKFGTINVWKNLTDVFDYLPLCALVNKKVKKYFIIK